MSLEILGVTLKKVTGVAKDEDNKQQQLVGKYELLTRN
jgi:hypothetical protein